MSGRRAAGATITDIARLADVSPATVSLVLNEKGGVASATRARVLELARELDYVPNLVARSLVEQRSRCVGMMVPSTRNALFPEIALGVEEVLQEHGYSLFLISVHDEAAREAREIAIARARGIDGIITSSALLDTDALRRLVDAGYPVVSVVRRIYDCPGLSFVILDNVRGGFLAMEHVLRLGHRRVGVLRGPATISAMCERHEGHALALRTYGVADHELLLRQGPATRELGFDAAAAWLAGAAAARPTAIVTANDDQALGVLDAVAAAGLEPGRDVAVVGFNNIEVASLRAIALTTISQRSREMGRLAATHLIQLVESKRRPTRPHRHVLPPELVVRRSCGFDRGGYVRAALLPRGTARARVPRPRGRTPRA